MIFHRITKEEVQSISKYAYKSNRESLLEQYYVNPVTRQIVKFIPSWVSPNFITVSNCLLGAFLSSVFLFCHLLYSFSIFTPSNRFIDTILILNIIYTQVYVLFDSVDGFLARALKYSTPLGEILDHTLDAYCSTLFTLMIYYAYQKKVTFFSIPLILLVKIEFLRINVEAYFTDIVREEKLGGTESMLLQAFALLLSLYFKNVNGKYLPLFDKGVAFVACILLVQKVIVFVLTFYKNRNKNNKINFTLYYVLLVYGSILYKWNEGGRVMNEKMCMILIQECPIFLIIIFKLIACKRGKSIGVDLFSNNSMLWASLVSIVVNVFWKGDLIVGWFLTLPCCLYGLKQYLLYVGDVLKHDGRTLFGIDK